MLKIARNMLLALAMTAATASAADKLSQDQVKELENLELFKRVQIQISNAYDTGSLYLLKVKIRGASEEIYLTKDKKYLIAGDVIDTSSGAKLTVPVDMSALEGNEAFTFGTGPDEYVLFTDPECPYCKRFEENFPKIADKVKIKVFYFPLDFHKNAKDIALYVMSQDSTKDKIQAMLNTDKNTPAFVNRKIDSEKLADLKKKLDKQMQIGRDLGVRGTPAVFDKEGNKVSWVQMLAKYGIKVN